MKWYQSKTNWSVIVTAVLNVVAAITGYDLPAHFNESALGVILIFLRQGVTKSGPEVK